MAILLLLTVIFSIFASLGLVVALILSFKNDDTAPITGYLPSQWEIEADKRHQARVAKSVRIIKAAN